MPIGEDGAWRPYSQEELDNFEPPKIPKIPVRTAGIAAPEPIKAPKPVEPPEQIVKRDWFRCRGRPRAGASPTI